MDQPSAVLLVTALLLAVLLPAADAYTRPDQVQALLAFRDANINKGPGWQNGFEQTQFGGQGVSGDQELGGPWVCPTPPQYSNGSCDPCGSNRPVPYWGNFNHVGCRGLRVTPDNTEGDSSTAQPDGIVTNIHITGEHLEGTLPIKEFCTFHYLHEFDVDNANFTGKGQIPDAVCDPSCFNNLQEIDWSYNKLTGTLPPCLATMPWLSSLKVENNYRLRGSIPAEYASAPHLWWIDVGYNQFSGSVPNSFITYTPQRPLQIFRLVNNTLSGDLYPISRAALQAVSLANNVGLCGMIPNAIRFAHGFNTYRTSLGTPCPGDATFPPRLTYASFGWPI